MKKIYSKSFYILIVIALLGIYACKSPKNKYIGPEGYDFNNPDKFNMPSSLLEISGIAFHNGNSDTVYSIQDEDGKLFKQKWDVKAQKNTKFSAKGDYEDVAILHDRVFVLKSNGSLYSFPISETNKPETDQVKVTKKLVPKGEYESLYADAQSSKIYILCKTCPADKKSKQVSGYVFNYDNAKDSLIAESEFKLNLEQLKSLNDKLKINLKPSALTFNPKTKEWFILASANKLLILTDEQWNIKKYYHLNSSTFNQPEGIAFDKDLNLFISNEGDEITNGNILKFKYLPTVRK